MTLRDKHHLLKAALIEMESVAVAFSGGVDSALLLSVAHQTLGESCVAVTVKLHSVPERDFDAAQDYCRRIGVRQIVVRLDELEIPRFADNPPDRCYHCKKVILDSMIQVAKEQGLAVVVEGSNLDDLGDYRPGTKALAESAVRSPLKEAGFTKADIRALARELEVPQWNKPSAACLSSRIPYGQIITREELRRIDAAEELLFDLGFSQARVRVHGDLARVEVPAADIERAALPENREIIAARLKELGYSYVTLDMQGYRTGSMNEVL